MIVLDDAVGRLMFITICLQATVVVDVAIVFSIMNISAAIIVSSMVKPDGLYRSVSTTGAELKKKLSVFCLSMSSCDCAQLDILLVIAVDKFWFEVVKRACSCLIIHRAMYTCAYGTIRIRLKPNTTYLATVHAAINQRISGQQKNAACARNYRLCG